MEKTVPFSSSLLLLELIEDRLRIFLLLIIIIIGMGIIRLKARGVFTELVNG